MSWPAWIIGFYVGFHVAGVWMQHRDRALSIRNPFLSTIKGVGLLCLLWWGGFYA